LPRRPESRLARRSMRVRRCAVSRRVLRCVRRNRVRVRCQSLRLGGRPGLQGMSSLARGRVLSRRRARCQPCALQPSERVVRHRSSTRRQVSASDPGRCRYKSSGRGRRRRSVPARREPVRRARRRQSTHPLARRTRRVRRDRMRPPWRGTQLHGRKSTLRRLRKTLPRDRRYMRLLCRRSIRLSARKSIRRHGRRSIRRRGPKNIRHHVRKSIRPHVRKSVRRHVRRNTRRRGRSRAPRLRHVRHPPRIRRLPRIGRTKGGKPEPAQTGVSSAQTVGQDRGPVMTGCLSARDRGGRMA
jgi:hypothetical protein